MSRKIPVQEPVQEAENADPMDGLKDKALSMRGLVAVVEKMNEAVCRCRADIDAVADEVSMRAQTAEGSISAVNEKLSELNEAIGGVSSAVSANTEDFGKRVAEESSLREAGDAALAEKVRVAEEELAGRIEGLDKEVGALGDGLHDLRGRIDKAVSGFTLAEDLRERMKVVDTRLTQDIKEVSQQNEVNLGLIDEIGDKVDLLENDSRRKATFVMSGAALALSALATVLTVINIYGLL